MSPRTMTQEQENGIEHAIDHPSQHDMDSGMHVAACNLWDELAAERTAHSRTLDVLAALVNAACDADEYVAIMDAEAHLKESGR